MNQTVRLLAAASVLAFVPVSAIAEEEKPFSGFYLGLESGFGNLKHQGYKKNNIGTAGGILGYRHQFDSDLVLGLEGGFHSTPDLEASNFGSIFNRDYKPTLSASALLGYAFGDGKKNMLFAKVGYSRLRYEVSLDDDLTNGGAAVTFPAGTLGKFTKGALKLGAGYERKINSVLSMRIGADYIKHKDIHKQLEGKIAAIINF